MFNSETTIGKGFKTLVWVVISAAVTAALGFVTNNPDLFNPVIVSAVNILLVLLKNFLNPEVKNI